MKKITLTFLFILSCFISFSQVASVKTIRVENETTAIGEDIPIGTIVIDITENKMYTAKTGILNTATISTSFANLEHINQGNALDLAKADKTVNITAGTGLTGGGTLAADRTIDVDIAAGADVTAGTADKILDASSVVNDNDMTADSEEKLPTQKSVKAYVDNSVTTSGDTKVDKTIVVGTGTATGLLGGGALSANLDLSVDIAIAADITAGTAGKIVDAVQGKVLKDLIDANTAKKQSYLQIDAFQETIAIPTGIYTLSKAVLSTVTNTSNFKVTLNGVAVSATDFTYNAGIITFANADNLSQYDAVTVTYTTNE